LIKLRTETVQDMKRLLVQTGQISLDDLVEAMIRLMNNHHRNLKDIGWFDYIKR